MCGIVGVFYRDQDFVPDEQLIFDLIKPIENRGPDGQKAWCAAGVGLGHARLSIIDLSTESDQPMKDPETGRVIVFNGEIYNYLELREELISKGYVFHTSGDTEVILKAYDCWGVDCLNKFNGMWAFAIYDPNKQHLFCARDRLGVKPFVYASNGDHLVFASELKSIVSVFPQFSKPNSEFLRFFVETGQFAGSTSTFYDGISNLLPGHYFILKPGETVQQHRYWQWQPSLISSVKTEEEVLLQFDELFTDAIRLRFRSDVPVGVCLSGGLDSSSIVALSSQMFGQKLPTFSCIYPKHPQLDESAYIKHTVDQYDCNSYLTTVEPTDIISVIKQSLWEQDGPAGTPSILSQRAVMKLAKEHVTVVLSGQGGDEVLGGYHSYHQASLKGLMRQFRQAPSIDGWKQFYTAAKAIRERTSQKTTSFKSMLDLWKKTKGSVRFETERYGKTVLDCMQPINQDDLSTKMLEDLLYNVLPRLLHYEDRNSMAFSLESRLPFLDYRLVEFAFSLPAKLKVRNERTKYMLSKMGESILPEPILNRKDKMGFNTPAQSWFKVEANREQLNRYIQKPPGLLENTSKKDFLEKYWARCFEGKEIPMRAELNLWRYFSACIWLESYC